MFTEIKGLAAGLETSPNAVRPLSKGPADGLKTSPHYIHSCIYSLLKLGVLKIG